MLVQNFFHLDCNGVIPECSFQCGKCIEEIQSVLKAVPGVAEVSTGKRDGIDGIVVRFDSDAIDSDDLMNAFRQLPSFYKGRFVPQVLDA